MMEEMAAGAKQPKAGAKGEGGHKECRGGGGGGGG